jgi:hypothetical protein
VRPDEINSFGPRWRKKEFTQNQRTEKRNSRRINAPQTATAQLKKTLHIYFLELPSFIFCFLGRLRLSVSHGGFRQFCKSLFCDAFLISCSGILFIWLVSSSVSSVFIQLYFLIAETASSSSLLLHKYKRSSSPIRFTSVIPNGLIMNPFQIKLLVTF